MLSCQLTFLPGCKRANAPAAPSVLLLHSRPGTAAVVLVAGWDDLGLVGLRNETGEYNCFLNTIIQCLWRCADFRQQQVGVYLLKSIWPQWPAACLLAPWLMHGLGQLAALSSQRRILLCLLIAGLQVAGWDAGFCAADPIVGALHTLFQQFEQQEQQRDHAGSGEGLAPVDPGPLREALAALPGQQFGVGESALYLDGWALGRHLLVLQTVQFLCCPLSVQICLANPWSTPALALALACLQVR